MLINVFSSSQNIVNTSAELPLTVELSSPDDNELNVSVFFKNNEFVTGLCGNMINSNISKIDAYKEACLSNNIPICQLEPAFTWDQLKKNSDQMVPVIVQDYRTDQVLMLAYMNEEAYEKTLETGLATFWSRSRKALWTKGETSGNFMRVVDVYPDCDRDTLLVQVRPDGPACHRGTEACFDTPPEEGFLGKLERVVRGRHIQMPEGHYTPRLFSEGVAKIAQKVGEEAVETILEAVKGDKDR